MIETNHYLIRRFPISFFRDSQINTSQWSENKRSQSYVTISESELVRIIQVLTKRNLEIIDELLEIDVGSSTGAYEQQVIDHNGILLVNSMPYMRLSCSDGDARSRKAYFIDAELFEPIMEILQCGMPPDTKFVATKCNAYFGKCHSTSLPMPRLPAIVVIPDCEVQVPGKYTYVSAGSEEMSEERDGVVEINPFDGAGIITVEFASEIADALGLAYTPSAFQIRALPGWKGEVFTYDLKSYATEYGVRKITDAWGKEYDFFDDNIDMVCTASQFKFYKQYASMLDWEAAFTQEINGYTPTFNISNYTDAPELLDKTVNTSYQYLQTLDLSDDEVSTLAQPTVNELVRMSNDPVYLYQCAKDYFGDMLPSHFQAVGIDQDCIGDPYIYNKCKEFLKSRICEARGGKLLVSGNYQVVCPDLYALAQHAFGTPTQNIQGLVKANTIYSRYWLDTGAKEVDLLRSPHIAHEHNVAAVKSSSDMEKWFKYQTSTIITGMYDTIMLNSNGADYDGDIVLTTDNPVILAAAKRGRTPTIVPDSKSDMPVEKVRIDDYLALMRAGIRSMKCEIGQPTNMVSKLWAEQQTPKSAAYIKRLSVIVSQRIDAAKTGAVVGIPSDIRNYVNTRPDPAFFKPLHKTQKKKLSNAPCTMNRIDSHINAETKACKILKPSKEWNCLMLIDNTPDCRSSTYRRVRDDLISAAEGYQALTKDIQGKKNLSPGERNRRYEAYWHQCKKRFQKRKINKGHMLDLLITAAYSDEKCQQPSHRAALWTLFADELLRRIEKRRRGPSCIPNRLSRRQERAAKHHEKKLTDRRMEPLASATIFEHDLDMIRQMNLPDDAQKVLLVLRALSYCDGSKKPVALYSGIRRDGLSKRRIEELCGIDRRRVGSILESLCAAGAINIEKVNKAQIITYSPDVTAGEIIGTPRSSSDISALVKMLVAQK